MAGGSGRRRAWGRRHGARRRPYLAWARAQRGGVLRDGLSLGQRQWRVVVPEEQGRRWWFVVAKGGMEASL